jgi:hypothetical protein
MTYLSYGTWLVKFYLVIKFALDIDLAGVFLYSLAGNGATWN